MKKRHSSLKTGDKDDLDHVFDEAERRFKEIKEIRDKKRHKQSKTDLVAIAAEGDN